MFERPIRTTGQAVFLLGMLAWGFAISYAEAGVDSRANALFLAGTVVMLVGMVILRRYAEPLGDE